MTSATPSPGPRDLGSKVEHLEELAAHAIVEGHHPRDCVSVALQWAEDGRRAVAANTALISKLKGNRNG